MSKHRVLTEIEYNGTIYVPRGSKPYTNPDLGHRASPATIAPTEVKSVDTSGFIELPDHEIDGLALAGTIERNTA